MSLLELHVLICNGYPLRHRNAPCQLPSVGAKARSRIGRLIVHVYQCLFNHLVEDIQLDVGNDCKGCGEGRGLLCHFPPANHQAR